MPKSTRIIIVIATATAVLVGILYWMLASPLSRKHISIVMHDPSQLKDLPSAEPLYLHCTIQLPRECKENEVRGFAIDATSKALSIHINMQGDASETDFHAYLIKQRKITLGAMEKPVMVEEGVTTLSGCEAYVMTYRFTSAINNRPCRAREVFVNRAPSKFYCLYFGCDDAEWSSNADVIDSSISTFHIDPD